MLKEFPFNNIIPSDIDQEVNTTLANYRSIQIANPQPIKIPENSCFYNTCTTASNLLG